VSAQRVRVTQSRTPDDSEEVLLTGDVQAALREAGVALDQRQPLCVLDGGVVALDYWSARLPERTETDNERQATRGSAAGSRQGSTRRQRAPGGSPGAESRIGINSLRPSYEAQLTELRNAYSTLQVFPDPDGMWLLVESAILTGLPRTAAFLIGVPDSPGMVPKAWAYWRHAGEYRWIGSRHTNFGDGSICAFSPEDNVWSEGGSLTALVDLYSVWAMRQLHLEVYGRWPGKQYTLTCSDTRAQAFYRLRECRDSELCGCGSETTRYAECCKPLDSRYNFVEMANAFLKQTPGGFVSRHPPEAVTSFIVRDSVIPSMKDVHLQMKNRTRG
jgi:hypothetical protein